MAITFRPVTAPDDDELMRLHELNPGYTVERLPDGALLVSPNGAAGGMRNANLALQLGLWERRARCGPVFDSSTGFRLADTSVFAPDGAFVRNARWEPLARAQRERYFDGAPDAAFEVVSRTDLRSAQLMKCEAYVRNGSALVVLLDPYRECVDRWLDGVHESLGRISSLDCAPVMPDFVLDVAEILDA
ncbi:MAG TPA: Uma2 family endonuclease [Candidatus Limnocylindrales bacterium]|nr:Uma2 family endonuclease [Candidatus Limnocylindrales bacterium]